MRRSKWRRLVPILLGSLVLAGCQTEGIRIPSTSTSFPETTGLPAAKNTVPGTLYVEAPKDVRSSYWGKPIAHSSWSGCKDDTLGEGGAVKLVQDRVAGAMQQAKIFSGVSEVPAPSEWKLGTDIRAFCSETRGFLFRWVGGIVALDVTLSRNGVVVFRRTYERVVTDQDPEYTGGQIGFVEQAMRRTMSDALRVTLGEVTKDIASAAAR
jgi:hypothetical protein